MANSAVWEVVQHYSSPCACLLAVGSMGGQEPELQLLALSLFMCPVGRVLR